MNGAAVFEVANKGDCEAVNSSELLADREEVQEGLGGMLETSVSCSTVIKSGQKSNGSSNAYHR